jgi:acyl dehydratase
MAVVRNTESTPEQEGSMTERPVLPKRIPEEPKIGATSAFSRTLTEADVALFIGVTWDVNPLHTDEEYTKGTSFGKRIVPGLLTASLLTHLGGLWAFIARDMHFEFIAPVFIGDTITAISEVVEEDTKKGWVRLKSRCENSKGEVVLRANITGYPGKFKELES